jgi:selenocysteine-specific elongation factor
MSCLARSASEAPRTIIIGTAGHIDHGKTALVHALTGVDTDRLPEEKRRGITIDLGFASMETATPNGAPLSLSLIDVPGHARFVRNMLAGTGGIDAVLLVISAEEGVKPQTEEHLAICTLLGIERGIIALTKADAASEERLRDVSRSVQNFLRGTFLAAAPIIPVSARFGTGIAILQKALVELSVDMPARRNDTLVRLPIDRVFTVKGFGTVVTGTLIGGSIGAGDELAIEPGQRKAKVRGIQVHSHRKEIAHAGSRAAVNLARVETTELGRGDILVAPSSVTAVDVIDVEVTLLPSARSLKHRARVHFHAFASECLTSTTLYDASTIEAGETKLARFRLKLPIALLPGDRFVLREGTPLATIGGGRVLDAHPLLRNKKRRTADWLLRIREASLAEQVCLRVARRGVTGIVRREISIETGVSEEALRTVIEPLLRDQKLHLIGEDRLLTSESFAAVQKTILREFDVRASSYPGGIKRSEFRSQLRLEPEVLDATLLRMEGDGQIRVAGDRLVPLNVGDATGPDRGKLATVSAEFEQAGVTPPSPNELAERLKLPRKEMRSLITVLLRDGTLVRLGSDDLCIHRRALEQLTGKVKTLRGQTLDVAAFKQLAGVSRKYAIPLLEHLDRQRITVKNGDRRWVF